MIFSLPIMYNCICILSFLRFEDASFANFSSASHIFDNLRMLPIEIMHPQLALSITCRYSTSKFCICNLLFLCLADIHHQNFASSIPENPLPQMPSSQKSHPPCSAKLCSFIHQAYDNVLRKNIGYEFLRIQRKRLEILKGQNFTLELRNLLFEGTARVAGF